MKNNIRPITVCVCFLFVALGLYFVGSIVGKYSHNNWTKNRSKSIESNGIDLVKLASIAKPSIVLIETFDTNGTPKGQGSGFFINENGILITNYHVIDGAVLFNIKTASGKIYLTKTVKAKNIESDIVCLQISTKEKTPYLKIANSLPPVGQEIAVIGNPFGLENTVCKGNISAIREYKGYGQVLQITAPLSPGSSGSPVLNVDGEIVGIATSSIIEGQSLNFAVSFTKIEEIIKEASPSPKKPGTVTGILYSKDKPVAIINKETYFEGDEVRGITVAKIHEDRVGFEKNGKSWFQQVQESPNALWQNP